MIFDRPIVCLVTTGEATDETFGRDRAQMMQTVVRAAEAGVDLIQLREKQLSARSLEALCAEIAARLERTETKLLVNDRVDVAIAAGADGVHLRGDSMPLDVVRRITPRQFLIGVSAHTPADVIGARDSGADYAIYGPVFSTPGKPDAVGLAALYDVCKAVDDFPVIAIGGIDEVNVKEVIDAGAAGFAAIRFLNEPSGLDFVRRSKNGQ